MRCRDGRERVSLQVDEAKTHAASAERTGLGSEPCPELSCQVLAFTFDRTVRVTNRHSMVGI
jgi:hypothetical protein